MKYKYLLLIFIFFVISCERDTSIEGPMLSDLYGEFKILEELKVNKSTVDFSKGEKAIFTARFSAITDWQLTITGKNSGAVKIIQGKSRVLDASNATWDGSTTYFPIFKEEDCEVELFVDRDSSFYKTSITVTGTKVNEGLLIADFESGMNPQWNVFKQSGANMSFAIKNDIPAAQGDYYYDMGGAVTWDWLIGMIEFPASAYGSPQFNLSDNPDKVYFNVILYLPEGITNAIVLFQFREDEDKDGNFDDASEDMYSLELKNLKPGWQLISVKYSDLVCLVNGQPSEPQGNKQHNPDALTRLSVLMLADPSSGYSQTLMDYVIFTENAPLNP